MVTLQAVTPGAILIISTKPRAGSWRVMYQIASCDLGIGDEHTVLLRAARLRRIMTGSSRRSIPPRARDREAETLEGEAISAACRCATPDSVRALMALTAGFGLLSAIFSRFAAYSVPGGEQESGHGRTADATGAGAGARVGRVPAMPSALRAPRRRDIRFPTSPARFLVTRSRRGRARAD